MHELPILFSAPMVRAILDGRKTVTRRVVNRVASLGPVTEFGRSDTPGYDWRCRDRRALWNDLRDAELLARCPYGQVGDRLWVREAYFGNHYLHPHEPEDERELRFRADGVEGFEGERIRWRPGIHMPRWASRIALEVTAVRVERLQDIREWEAMNEGAPLGHDESRVGDPTVVAMHRIGFQRLWDRLAKQGSTWADNPWVWVVEFRRIELPQDRAGETGSHGTACGHVAPGAS